MCTATPRARLLLLQRVVFSADLILHRQHVGFKFEEWAQLRHHPRQRDVGQLVVVVIAAAADITMCTGEPNLLEVLSRTACR